jgi:hypothetical protein
MGDDAMKYEFELKHKDGSCVNTPLEMLEMAWAVHYPCISAHAWPNIAHYTSAVYCASQELIMQLIPLAFPGYDAKRIWDLAHECGEINAEGFRECLDYEMQQAKWKEFQRGWMLRDELKYTLEENSEIMKAMRDWLQGNGSGPRRGGPVNLSPEAVIERIERDYDGGGVLGFLSDNDLVP